MTSSAGFQAAFSANSGSEVDDSAATHLGCGGSGAEFLGHSVESTQTELHRHNNAEVLVLEFRFLSPPTLNTLFRSKGIFSLPTVISMFN